MKYIKDMNRDNIELVLAVIIPSVMVGVTGMCLYMLFSDKDISSQGFNNMAVPFVICSLVALVYFSIKATVYKMSKINNSSDSEHAVRNTSDIDKIAV